MTLKIHKEAQFIGSASSIYKIRKDSKNQYLFSSAGNGLITRWDLKKKNSGVPLVKFKNSIFDFQIDDESNEILIAENHFGIFKLNLLKNDVEYTLQTGKGYIYFLREKDSKLFIGTSNGELLIIDRIEFRIKQRIKLSEKSLRCIEFTDKEIIIGTSTNELIILNSTDLSTKKIIFDATNSIFCLKISPNKKYLLTGGLDAHLRIYNIKENFEIIEDIVAHMYTINDICFNEIGDLFATCSKDKTIKIWESNKFTLLKVIDNGRFESHSSSVNCLLWDDFLFAGSDDKTISKWKINYE